MLVYCDMHIHSCLSPCANDDMTPWNLVGMAKVKGLDVIALTDHNTTLNVPEAIRAGEAYGVAVIPGIEITSREEVHMLAYFDTVEQALTFGEVINQHLPDVPNRDTLFGNQIIIGTDDEPTGTVNKLLLNATDLSVDEVYANVVNHGGICVPAHINRGANGMLGALGLMPALPAYPVVEIYARIPCPAYATRGRMILQSSDAHRLEDVAERSFSIEAEATTAQAVVAAIRKACILTSCQ